jgi:short-subunit dehydrogenase
MTAPLPVAVVTGACSGIGREIARRLAARGDHALVLVSENRQRLEAIAQEVFVAHGTIVHPIVCDLARPEAAAEIHTAVAALGVAVDVLVVNAGMFFFGEVADAEPAKANVMLQLHVVTPSLLCTLFARDMRTRGRGRIMLTSSISAWRAFPGIAYYGGTKTYLRTFAAALRSELAPYGVTVTTLAPGATDTGLYDPTVVDMERARRFGVMMDPAKVADAGLRALFAGKAECVPGAFNRMATVAMRIVPQRVIDLVRRRASWLPLQG